MTLNLTLMNQPTGQLRLALASYSQSRVHFIDNIQLERHGEKSVHVSFFLPAEHQLDLEETVAYLAHGPSIPVTTPVPLKSLSLVPFECAMPFGQRKITSPTPMFSCREFEEFYQVELVNIKQEGSNRPANVFLPIA